MRVSAFAAPDRSSVARPVAENVAVRPLSATQAGPSIRPHSSQLAAFAPPQHAGPIVIQRQWKKVRHSQNDYYWDSHVPHDPSMHPPAPHGANVVANPHAPIDPRAGQKPRTGGGGFALSGGTSSTATFNMPWGQQHLGPPTVSPQTGSETINYGNFSVTHHGVEPQTFDAPTPSSFTTPQPSMMPMLQPHTTSSFVTQDVMSQFSGRRDDTTTFPTQSTVMGQSASNAMNQSAHPVPQGQMDWLHRHRFTHGGIDHQQPQVPENLVSGTHGSNIRHLTLENAVSQATDMVGVVPTSTSLENPISQQHHTYQNMNYTVHSPFNPLISQTSTIDLLNPQMPRSGDQHYANMNINTFMGWATVHDAIESGHMTPEDLGDQGAAQYAAWRKHHDT